MPIDASIPLGVKPVQLQNPLALAGQAAQIQNAVNLNRLFNSRQAAGEAFQGSINPDGTYNQNALLQNLRTAGPTAAIAALETANQGQAGAAANYSLSMKQLTYAANGAMQILADNGGLAPRDAVKSFYDRAAAEGYITPAQRDQAESAFSDDPARNASIIRQRLTQNLSSQDAMMATTPGSGTFSNNQSVTGVQIAPRMAPGGGGAITAQGPEHPLYLSPGEAASRTTLGVTSQGAPIQGPLSAVTPPSIAGALAGGGSPFANGGRLPAALRGPNAVPDGGAVVTGLGPAQTAAQSAMGSQSATAFSGIADEGVKARSQSSILANMLGDTSLFTTGPGQDWIKTKQAIVQRFAPDLAKSFGVSPDSLAANESFDKFANQLADAQGAGSDARMAVNQGANPSSHLTPAGADMILRQLLGNSDYLQARAKLASAYPNQADRPGFEASIASNLDPRVFQYARMTPEQKGTFLTSMKSGKAAFKKAYGWVSQNGLLSDPNAAQ